MPRVLIVDLNNFARYPTLAIAYLVAPLRRAGIQVEVLSPLHTGAPGIEREQTEDWREHLKRRLNFSTHPLMLRLHEPLRKAHQYWSASTQQPSIAMVTAWLKSNDTDLILLSAYLNHYPAVGEIAQLAKTLKIPLLLGGPAFASEATIQQWLDLPGVTAIFGGEADLLISNLALDAIARRDLGTHPGVFLKNRSGSKVAPPLNDLDRLPIPDFSDFAWERYPHRIIPVMTGRGCSWRVCTFCSDVTTANGRSYRSRSLPTVLNELQLQSVRYGSKDFIFLDLKLNSNLDIWYGLIRNFQKIIPGGRWIATVHVAGKGENGLDLATLQAARQAGLTRISFGLETGSQQLARRMAKGTDVDRNQQFVQDAWQAGLSVRCSMILGYPGETSKDLQLTRAFLERNIDEFDRVRPARFKVIPGTRFEKLYQHRPTRFKGITMLDWDYRYARAQYTYQPAMDPAYRRVKRDILQLVHQINRKPLRDDAIQFDGLM